LRNGVAARSGAATSAHRSSRQSDPHAVRIEPTHPARISRAKFLNALSALEPLFEETASVGESSEARTLGAFGAFPIVFAVNMAVGFVRTALDQFFEKT